MRNDGAHFAAMFAFGCGRPSASRRVGWSRHCNVIGGGSDTIVDAAVRRCCPRLGAIDQAMDEVTQAQRRLHIRFRADSASSGPVDSHSETQPEAQLTRLEAEVQGDTNGGRRLLARLAYRRAEIGRDATRAADLAERALAGGQLLAQGIRSPEPLAAVTVLGLAGRPDSALPTLDAIIAQAERTGSFAVLAAARGQRGGERLRRGSLIDALEDLGAARDIARGQPWETMIDDGRAFLLRVLAERDRPEAAEAELEAWHATGPLPDTLFGNRLLIERGRLRLVQGRFGDGVADFELAGQRLADSPDSALFEWRSPAALAHHRAGEHAAALELAQEDLARAQAWGAPRQLGIATATIGLIEGGRAGVNRLRCAVEILEKTTSALELARANAQLGAALRRAREVSEARVKLRVALELAMRCSATALAASAHEEFAATGVHRRRGEVLSGPRALTPSERRVASMAASGLSNPEIARGLFVTRKTVEMHVGNVYRKLGINTRRDLGSALTGRVAI
jgi:DNA-binding CsgD family transcriptional regulator